MYGNHLFFPSDMYLFGGSISMVCWKNEDKYNFLPLYERLFVYKIGGRQFEL